MSEVPQAADSANGEETEVEPGLASAVVAIANSEPAKGLLGPAMASFGAYFGERADEITARWRAERQANAERLRKRVFEQDPAATSKPISERQAHLIVEWHHSGSNIGDDEPELSALWESILSEIYKDNSSSEQFLSIGRELTPDDIRILKQIRKSGPMWSSRFDYIYRKLLGLNLIYKPRFSDVAMRYVATFMAIVLVSFGILLFPWADFVLDQTRGSESARDSLSTLKYGPYIFAFLILLAPASFIINLISKLNTIELTPLGESLVSGISRYSVKAAPKP